MERVFGSYELIMQVGRGAMGEVWRARDTAKGREVAVKVLGSWVNGDPNFAARFRRECALTAGLSSPHIVPIHNYGEIDGQLYLEMPLLAGADLGGLLEDGPLSPTRAVGIAVQVARALAVAHDAGLFHRDVKPSNILVTTAADGEDHAYLIDFGITRATDGTRVSQSDAVIGTPAYMAPECFAGAGDARSDVYSLGCVLYQMLTGQQPFRAQHVFGYARLHESEPPPRPSAVAPTVPAALDAVVARALAKAPDARFPTAVALATAARATLGSATSTIAVVDGGYLPRTTCSPTGTPSPDPPTLTGRGRSNGPTGPGGPPGPPTWSAPPPDPDEPEDPDESAAHSRVTRPVRRQRLVPPQTIQLWVRPDYRIVDHALEHGSPVPFVDNQPSVDLVRQRIEHSRGGALLVTGFNGVGKTTVVRRALAEMRARMLAAAAPESQPLVEVWLEVPGPITADELMVKLIRNLCEEMRRSGVLDRLPHPTRLALDTAYRRTSLSLRSMVVEGRERSAELKGGEGILSLPVVPGIAHKRSRSTEREESFREYTLADAEHDFRRIVADLRPTQGRVPPRRGPRSWWRTATTPAPWSGRLVVVIDELDKLTAEPEGAVCLESLLRGLKSVFTAADVHFIFVGGADLHTMARAAERRGSSIWNGVFGRVVYVPCLRRGAAAALLDGVLAGRPPGLVRGVLCDYLEYRGRGLPRRILAAINEAVEWPDDPRGCAQLVVDDEVARRVAFFAEVERRLGPLWAQPRQPGPRDDPIDIDRRRIAVHLMVDWALARGNGTFSVLDFAEDQESRPGEEMISDTESAALLAELSSDNVAVLVRYAPHGLDRTALDVELPRETVYRVDPALLDAGEGTNGSAGLGILGRGRYRLEHELYRGAIARTYRGVDLYTNRAVVVKAFDLPELLFDGHARERFRRETDLARHVEHANLAATLDIVEDDAGRPALVSEFVPGCPLSEILRRGDGSDRLAVAVGYGMADLLNHLHENGIVRLGLKPSRIVVQDDLRPVLVDLGLARQAVEPEQLTALGAVVGTPGYAAPEQLRGGAVDVRSDLYSLGLILHEILTGRPVRTTDDVRDLVDGAQVERVRVDRLPCSPALRQAIGALLVPEPQWRCPHPKEALRLFANTPPTRVE